MFLWCQPRRKAAGRWPGCGNYPPTDNINDPVPGFLDALSHNPKKSVAFFDESSGHSDDKMSNFDYLLGGGDDFREWPKNDDGEKWSQKSLGHALEAATEAVPYDSDAKHSPHSQESANLVHRLVEEFGAHPDHLDDSELRPSLGKITADYMRDVQEEWMAPEGCRSRPTGPTPISAASFRRHLDPRSQSPRQVSPRQRP